MVFERLPTRSDMAWNSPLVLDLPSADEPLVLVMDIGP